METLPAPALTTDIKITGDDILVEIEDLSTREIDHDKERKVLRKTDYVLVPMFCLLLTAAFLDRTFIGNSRIQGMEEDLNMKGSDYNIALFMFFIPYLLLDVPCNIVMKKLRPSRCLSSLMYAWLLAYAIGHMDNVGGYSAWRWIFIIEGFFTIVVAIFSFSVLPDWPEQTRHFTEGE
ncbi:uncharacterized protein Z518_02428 [Rhinocladiella mackenziei CBS 650.93]|uniref:Rhinocladiella mackenziei CBS 650.93 unplaced genomic scaffold supercont1.2, whole genome shotgun sequence n=1 Tax=Rhinocladiella mackenziei CBS 650.93 TaxID=1442369 RepID=A0A0D2IPG2_9EURO|nr:uncharacterized protein Z518_02428 [Rhinocladiella mackenziei CBS 650.93]KIX07774.1 hypothetical protein Z518_02428 [Rhinocladiella mackenziei CBS 650.93]